MDLQAVAFDSSAFIAGLFLLQYGADSFIENSALILGEVGVAPTLAHLVTAGAEWEELAIVVACIFEKETPLALGNVLGSVISNILGGLGIAMVLYPGTMDFDACAKFYSGACFISASVFLLIQVTDMMNFTGGIFYLVFFSVYIFAVGLAIYEGYLTIEIDAESEYGDSEASPPSASPQQPLPTIVMPDEEDGGDDESEAGPPIPKLQISLFTSSLEVEPSTSTPLLGQSAISAQYLTSPRRASRPMRALTRFATPPLRRRPTLRLTAIPSLSPRPTMPLDLISPLRRQPTVRSTAFPFLSPRPTMPIGPTSPALLSRTRTFHQLPRIRSSRPVRQHTMSVQPFEPPDILTIAYHVGMMTLGLLAISLCGFVLSQASARLAKAFQISPSIFGITILSIFTTLPEKFISVIAGLGDDSSLLVASIAGSNVFLLTLCLGVLITSGGEGDSNAILAKNITPFEVWFTWGCTLVMLVIVWVGGRRWMGWGLLVGWGVFIGVEFLDFFRIGK